jgi:hypothetical protein
MKYIQLMCGLCLCPLVLQDHPGSSLFDLYLCRDCQLPQHATLYRQIFHTRESIILADSLRVDEYHIIRYYQPAQPNGKTNYTIIFKNALGMLSDSDIEPLSLAKPVCEIDQLIDLPMTDIKLLKRKLETWTMFS